MRIFVLLLVSSVALASTFKNAPYNVCFTPGGRCDSLIVRQIDHAKHSIHVQAYGFTAKPIVSALLRAHARGVKVFALLDKSNATHKYSALGSLVRRHIPVLIDRKPRIAHNKVMVLDGHIVITGSYNFTKSAQKSNAENVLIIQSRQLARLYEENFVRRRGLSVSVAAYCKRTTKCKKLS